MYVLVGGWKGVREDERGCDWMPHLYVSPTDPASTERTPSEV